VDRPESIRSCEPSEHTQQGSTESRNREGKNGAVEIEGNLEENRPGPGALADVEDLVLEEGGQEALSSLKAADHDSFRSAREWAGALRSRCAGVVR